MAGEWSYKREERTFDISEGEHELTIKSAATATSKAGNPVLKMQLTAEEGQSLWYYITFLKDRPEITNANLTALFDAFAGIQEGDFDMRHWVGQKGRAIIKKDPQGYATLNRWVKAEQIAPPIIQQAPQQAPQQTIQQAIMPQPTGFVYNGTKY